MLTFACHACCHVAGRDVGRSLLRHGFGKKVVPEVRAACQAMLDRGLWLCDRCKKEILQGNEGQLRATVAIEIFETNPDSRSRPGLFVESEIAITLASWMFAPFAAPAYSAGFAFLNTVFSTYPRAAFDGASLLERDLGSGVIGVFTVEGGLFVIENLASYERRHGHARRALHTLCVLADTHQAVMVGAVESNAYGDLLVGADVTALLRWYASEGFHQVDPAGAMVVRQPLSRGQIRQTRR